MTVGAIIEDRQDPVIGVMNGPDPLVPDRSPVRGCQYGHRPVKHADLTESVMTVPSDNLQVCYGIERAMRPIKWPSNLRVRLVNWRISANLAVTQNG